MKDAIEVSFSDIDSNGTSFVEDHLGNKYKNVAQMCKAYGVRSDSYCHKKKRGYTLEEILTGKRKTASSESRHTVTDHLGNTYSSKAKMCEAYGINISTFNARLKNGKSLEEALTLVPSPINYNIPCQDHLGNHYNSQTEMARAYGLTIKVFAGRKRLGWDIEKILTTPIKRRFDHQDFIYNGITYTSKNDFCEKHGLNYDLFIKRTSAGMSIEEAIEAGKNKYCPLIEPVDHFGYRYKSIKEMCEAYEIPVHTFKYRLLQNWSLKDALTKPLGTHTSQIYKSNTQE